MLSCCGQRDKKASQGRGAYSANRRIPPKARVAKRAKSSPQAVSQDFKEKFETSWLKVKSEGILGMLEELADLFQSGTAARNAVERGELQPLLDKQQEDLLTKTEEIFKKKDVSDMFLFWLACSYLREKKGLGTVYKDLNLQNITETSQKSFLKTLELLNKQKKLNGYIVQAKEVMRAYPNHVNAICLRGKDGVNTELLERASKVIGKKTIFSAKLSRVINEEISLDKDKKRGGILAESSISIETLPNTVSTSNNNE